MSAPQIEPELLAAFLDGAASPAEREAVLRTIAGSKDAYAEFMEASAVRRELEAGESPTAQEPPGAEQPTDIATRRGRPRYLAPLAMLAAASAVFVVFRNAPASDAGVLTIAQSTRIAGATGSGSLSRVLGARWDEPGWSVTRGAAPTRQSSARAFRSGVRFAQLEVAVNASDSSAVKSAVGQLQDLLNDVLGSAPLSARLDVLGKSGAFGTPADRSEIAEQLKLMHNDEAWFDLGVWTGSAQLAAKSGQDLFFAADGVAMTELAQLSKRKFEPAELWGTVSESIRALAAGEWRASGGYEALLEMLTKILSAAGG
jgi:anti-sigma factor RsiW